MVAWRGLQMAPLNDDGLDQIIDSRLEELSVSPELFKPGDELVNAGRSGRQTWRG
jgi:hypothetical protein